MIEQPRSPFNTWRADQYTGERFQTETGSVLLPARGLDSLHRARLQEQLLASMRAREEEEGLRALDDLDAFDKRMPSQMKNKVLNLTPPTLSPEMQKLLEDVKCAELSDTVAVQDTEEAVSFEVRSRSRWRD